MFRTFGNTWRIIKISWQVLQEDRELIVFPILSGIGVLVVIGVAAGVFGAMGTFTRLGSTGQGQVNAGDVIVAVITLFCAFFAVNYFNAALIAAARERLTGGDPTLGSGMSAVNKHLGAVAGWSAISVVIFVVLQSLRNRRGGILYDIVIGLVGAAWAYMTFFVIPVLVVEGVGPIEAIKRSAGYFRRTWGEQLVSNFGFGILHFGVVILAVAVVAILSGVSPIAAIIVGIPILGIGFAVIAALEGIFKIALYEYATGNTEIRYFDRETLAGAYSPGDLRGVGGGFAGF